METRAHPLPKEPSETPAAAPKPGALVPLEQLGRRRLLALVQAKHGEVQVMAAVHMLFRAWCEKTGRVKPADYAFFEHEVLVPEMRKAGVDITPTTKISASGLVQPNGQPALITH